MGPKIRKTREDFVDIQEVRLSIDRLDGGKVLGYDLLFNDPDRQMLIASSGNLDTLQQVMARVANFLEAGGSYEKIKTLETEIKTFDDVTFWGDGG